MAVVLRVRLAVEVPVAEGGGVGLLVGVEVWLSLEVGVQLLVCDTAGLAVGDMDAVGLGEALGVPEGLIVSEAVRVAAWHLLDIIPIPNANVFIAGLP